MSSKTDRRTTARESLELHYQGLWHRLDRSAIVPFLGAAASVVELIGDESSSSLPTGRELANRFAAILGFSEDELDGNDLNEVASCFELYTGRAYLEKELKAIFGRAARPGPLHRFIAELTPPPSVIVTTNYDTLIEEAFRTANRDFHLIMTPVNVQRQSVLMWWGPGDSVARVESREHVQIQPTGIPIIYKIHGGLAPNGEWITSIITEDDYFEIGGRLYASSFLPMQMASVLHHSALLFLGYSLRDVHVRFLIRQSSRRAARRHYVVTKRMSRIDRMMFDKLGIACIELPIAEFLEQLIVAKTSHQAHAPDDGAGGSG